jgi:hypothetical protein
MDDDDDEYDDDVDEGEMDVLLSFSFTSLISVMTSTCCDPEP